MRDWTAYVRSRLALPDLTPARETRIVRELAAQLEDFYREARARGSSEAEADEWARGQIPDWNRMALDVRSADRAHARPRFDRWLDAVDFPAASEKRGIRMLFDVLRDLRYGLRQLAGNPAFSLVAVLTLALGIGATSAIFSVINGVVLRPLPYRDPDSLVRVNEVVPQYGLFSVAPASFFDWRQQNTVFERIAMSSTGSATLLDASGPEPLPMARVSWDIFELLGVEPALGRRFRREEDAPGGPGVVILSHGMWQRRFASDPSLLGQSITINGAPSTIVGVMPPGFYFPTRDAEFWSPIALDPAKASRGAHYLSVIARLKPGVTLTQADVEMRTIAERLAQQYPDTSAKESAVVRSLHETVVANVRPALVSLLAAVAVVILIACANVANLLLVRAAIRQKEIAVRTALGAGRRRLVLQMLTESLVLALAGGVLGIALAYLSLGPIKALSPGSIPRIDEVAVDGNVLLFTFGISIVTGLLFGLVPAWQAGRTAVGDVLKEGGRSSTTGGGRRIRRVLLVTEVAMSIVLLVSAMLLVRSFARLVAVDPGFQPEKTLAFRVALPAAAYNQPHARVRFFDDLLARLRSQPGVAAAAMGNRLPFAGGDYVLSFAIQGRPPAAPGSEPSANHRSISPDYFRALGIPLLRGRTFTDADSDKSPMVAVVDDAFVRQHFPDEDPIGRGVDIGNGTDGFYEIVGVVGSVHGASLDQAMTPTMYVPYKQEVFGTMWMAMRTDGDPAQLAATARASLREIDPALPAFSLRPLTEFVDQSVAARRFSMLILGAFALFAMFLAAVGLYGLVAYTVSQRTPEIGLRIAIGAGRSDVFSMIVGDGMKLALVGVAIGLAGAFAVARVLQGMLFEVSASDPASYGGTAAVLLAVAALACYLPARRATRVDPVAALRNE